MDRKECKKGVQDILPFADPDHRLNPERMNPEEKSCRQQCKRIQMIYAAKSLLEGRNLPDDELCNREDQCRVKRMEEVVCQVFLRRHRPRAGLADGESAGESAQSTTQSELGGVVLMMR